MNLPAFLQSSVDPAKLSLTIKGLIVLVPSIVMLLGFFGISASPESVTEFINQIAVLAGALMSLVGIVRKFLPQPPKQ